MSLENDGFMQLEEWYLTEFAKRTKQSGESIPAPPLYRIERRELVDAAKRFKCYYNHFGFWTQWRRTFHLRIAPRLNGILEIAGDSFRFVTGPAGTPTETTPDLRQDLFAVAQEIDTFFDGWCPTTCTCAVQAKPLAERLHRILQQIDAQNAA